MMKQTLETKIGKCAEVRAQKRKGQSVWASLFRSLFAFLLACGAIGVMVILALRDQLSAILAGVLGLVILLAATFVSQTIVAGFTTSLPGLIRQIRGR